MKHTRALIGVILLSAACGSGRGSPTAPTPSAPLVVVDGAGQLGAGYDLLVNTDRRRTDWVSVASDGIQAAYPSGQIWGFIGAVNTGPSDLGNRKGSDLSGYKTFEIQMRGAVGGEAVDVGIKDSSDPDDGTETRKSLVLTSVWQTYTFPVSDFRTADPKRIYLLFEVVFNGAPGRYIFVRSVRYLP